MAMITFEDLPSTNTPINAANLNNNFTEILNLMYPVGSYYETSDATFNPNTAWGGTWVEDSKGRVTVGQNTNDTSFDTIGETGGSKTDNLSNAYAKVGRASSSLSTISYKAHAGSGATFDRTLQGGGGIDGTVVNASDTSDLGGSVSTLQPYIVVKRWHRTA